VIVTYRVRARIEGGNEITINLPDRWTDKDGDGGSGFGTLGELINGDFTSFVADMTASTDSYVTVDTPYTSAVVDDLGATVTGTTVMVTVKASDTATAITMKPGNIITVTYHNVKVKKVEDGDFTEVAPNRDPVDAQLMVTDTIVRSKYTDGGTAVSLYNPTTLFKVSPPELSFVTVSRWGQ
jgi:hypothetical protein